MKLELGGGTKARGAGWINMDQVATADIIHDLDVTPWPIANDSVEEVYTSHCLEHLKGTQTTFTELCRVCKIGADIEIRVPHPSSDLAMVYTHLHVFSPMEAINIEQYFPREFWLRPRRLKLENIGYGPTVLLDQAKRELPFLRGLSNDVIMRWIPRTCHECVFHYRIVENEYYTGVPYAEYYAAVK